MANILYPLYKQALLAAGVSLSSGTVKAQLVDTGAYTYAATDQFLSAVPAGARIGSPVTLANKTVTNGVFDADDITFTAVPAGTGSASAVEALVLYRDSGAVGTSELVAFIDTATGLPFTPNGGNATVTWDSLGIFQI